LALQNAGVNGFIEKRKGITVPNEPKPQPQWQKSVSPVADPLAAYAGRPIISGAVSNRKYIGRVIVELWELVPQSGQTSPVVIDDVDGIAISADATPSATASGDHATLLDRVAAALPQRVAKGNPFR